MTQNFGRKTLKRLSVVLAIGWVLAYLAYFFSLDLPNADIPGSPGKKYSRLTIWQWAVPGLRPNQPCQAQQALTRLMDAHYLGDRVPIACHALLILVAAVSVGSGLLRLIGIGRLPAHPSDNPRQPTENSGPQRSCLDVTFSEWLVMAYGIGISVLSLATLALGLAGWMYRPAVLFLLALAAFIFGAAALWNAWVRWRRVDHHPRVRRSVSWPKVLCFLAGGAATFLFIAVSLLGAMLPATDFDVREYHLQGPKEFYLAGQIEFLSHNVYTSMPFATEMLSLLGMIVAGDWWWGSLVGQTVLASFSVMTALGIYALGRRIFGPAAGWVGAFVYLTTPWVYRISIIPYTENALCFFLLAGVLASGLAIRYGWFRYWFVAGLLVGSAAACKYTALVSTVLPLSIVSLTWPLALRPRREAGNGRGTSPEPSAASSGWWPTLPSAGVFGLGVLLTCGPWLAKSWVMTGNPTYPLLYRVFGGRNWTPEKDLKWERAHRVSLLVNLGLQHSPESETVSSEDPQHGISFRLLSGHLLDVTAQADWLSPLLFSLAPLALLVRSVRARAAWLWLPPHISTA